MTEHINEWLNLPHVAPFVPPCELSIIQRHNEEISNSLNELQLDVLPEPYIGNPNAPIYLLNLNPGFSSRDLEWHSRTDFAKAIRANLAHESLEYPFYFMDPQFAESEGAKWWLKKLWPLVNETNLKSVAKSLFCVEYIGYHSFKYERISPKVSGGYLPTQQYAASLVRGAIQDGKKIVLMRSRAQWFWLVPELEGYPNLVKLNNPQNPCISKNNLDQFQDVLDLISS